MEMCFSAFLSKVEIYYAKLPKCGGYIYHTLKPFPIRLEKDPSYRHFEDRKVTIKQN